MVYLLILVYLIVFPITMLVMLYKILDKLEKEKANIERTDNKRKTHPTIAKASYTSPLVGRSVAGYDKYKNKDGLYEPVRPKNGIEIKKKED